MAYRTELTAFAVRQGKEARAEEWMNTLVARQGECVQTLDREGMHFEAIFRSTHDGRMYLSWLSVQSEGAPHVSTSTLPIDVLHMEFWRECIDRDVPPIDFAHVVSFVPATVAEAIGARDTAFRPEKAKE